MAPRRARGDGIARREADGARTSRRSALIKKCERLHRARLAQIEKDHAANIARLREESEAEAKNSPKCSPPNMAKREADFQAQWLALESEWKKTVQPLCDQIRAANAGAEKLFPEWEPARWKDWTPPQEFKNAAKFARLEVDLAALAGTMPKDKRLALPGPDDPIFRAAVAGVSARRLDSF